jgi:hypothetical protein
MISVSILGDGIYETMRLPEVPRKGDILWLASLTMGRSNVPEVVVSKVEWARDQTAWAYDKETEGIHVWLTVRRHKSVSATQTDEDPK